MKFWILRPREDLPQVEDVSKNPWEPWYDKTFGFIIRADTETEARHLAQTSSHAGDEVGWPSRTENSLPAWTDPKYSTCVVLDVEGDPGVVMTDYHSA